MSAVMVSLFCTAWSATLPSAYESLGRSLQEERASLRALREEPYFQSHLKAIDAYDRQLEEAFRTGRELDAAIAGSGDGGGRLGGSYLHLLRKAQQMQQRLRRVYAEALRYAMEHDERPLLEALLNHPLEPLQNRRIREEIKAFYEPRRDGWRSERAEALLEEMAFEAENRAAYVKELRAYEAHAEVTLAEKHSREGKRLLKRLNNLELYMVRKGGGYEVYAENGNVYSVTAILRFVNAKNLAFGAGRSVTVELPAKGTALVRSLTPLERGRPAAFGLKMTMAMGLVSARHDDSVAYRIPFAAGRTVTVTQGYGGQATHRGASTYAVDFEAPVGTPIYAARGGTVVAAESGNDRVGYDKSFSRYANYILIEHEDHTFAEYAHLKQHGVVVAVGRQVRAGEHIGYSGNTGYSSGPHLHFEVLKVDDAAKGSTMSIPVRMKSGDKIVTHPKMGDLYTVSR